MLSSFLFPNVLKRKDIKKLKKQHKMFKDFWKYWKSPSQTDDDVDNRQLHWEEYNCQNCSIFAGAAAATAWDQASPSQKQLSIFLFKADRVIIFKAVKNLMIFSHDLLEMVFCMYFWCGKSEVNSVRNISKI